MGTIWGAPAALALTAVTAVLIGLPSTALFWLALVAAIAWSLYVQQPERARRDLCLVTAGMLVVLLAGYYTMFDPNRMTPAASWINGGVIGIIVVMATTAARSVPSAVPSPLTAPVDVGG